jgi:hypothetical protein
MNHTESTTFPSLSSDQAMYWMARKLMVFHAANAKTPAMRERFAKAHEEFAGTPLTLREMRNPEHVVQPPILWGPPGGGKTSLTESAVRMMCDFTGMRMVVDPTPDQQLDPEKDYVFVRATFVEAESPHSAIGIPISEEISGPGGKKYMAFLKEGVYVRMAEAAGAFLFVDDLPSAAPAIQNFLLRVFYHPSGRQLGGMAIPNTFVAGAGNLGDLDGTHTFSVTQALYGRSANFYVDDNLENFVARLRNRHFDPKLGVAHMDSFMEMNPSLLRSEDDPSSFDSKQGPRPTPRGIEAATRAALDVLALHSGRGANASPSQYAEGFFGRSGPNLFSEIKTEVGSIVGRQFAEAYEIHLQNMYTGIAQMVRSIMEQGKLEGEALENFRANVSDRAGRDQTKVLQQSRLAYGLAQAAYLELSQKPGEEAHQIKVMTRLIEGLCGPGEDKDLGLDSTRIMLGLTNFFDLVRANGGDELTVSSAPESARGGRSANYPRVLSLGFTSRAVVPALSQWVAANPGRMSDKQINAITIKATYGNTATAKNMDAEVSKSLRAKAKAEAKSAAQAAQAPPAAASSP